MLFLCVEISMVRHYFNIFSKCWDELSISKSTILDVNIPVSILSWKYKKLKLVNYIINGQNRILVAPQDNQEIFNTIAVILVLRKAQNLSSETRFSQIYILKVIIVIAKVKSIIEDIRIQTQEFLYLKSYCCSRVENRQVFS